MDEKTIYQKILELQAGQQRILELLESQQRQQPRLEDFIDPITLSKKLRINDRTLRRHKKAGILSPYRLGSTDYYLESEVIEAMRKNGISFK